MSTFSRQLTVLAVTLAAAGGLAHAQVGGMVEGGTQGPGFMGAGAGSTGTVDGGMAGMTADPGPGPAGTMATRRDTRRSRVLAAENAPPSIDDAAAANAAAGLGSNAPAGNPGPESATLPQSLKR